MNTQKKMTFGERVIDSLTDFAEALESGEDIPKKFSCRKVVLDLSPTPYSAELVVETRKVLQASQAVFARFLGVATRTVSSWEQGIREPDKLACRFMDEIRNDPEHWKNRLKELIRPKSQGKQPEASAT
jgi:putative transcriptional regulator